MVTLPDFGNSQKMSESIWHFQRISLKDDKVDRARSSLVPLGTRRGLFAQFGTSCLLKQIPVHCTTAPTLTLISCIVKTQNKQATYNKSYSKLSMKLPSARVALPRTTHNKKGWP